MRLHTGSTATQRTLALAIPSVATAWFLTVPTILTSSTFLALVGLLIGFAWAARTSYLNGQPASSLAQLLRVTEHPGSGQPPRDTK